MKHPKFLETIYEWTTAKASRTWYAHGIVALVWTIAIGSLAEFFSLQAPEYRAAASTGILFAYSIREMGDEVKHRQMGEWLKTATLDQVTYAADQKGDLIGPIFVCATCWLILL